METVLMNVLMIVVLGTIVFCVGMAMGFDAEPMLTAARPYAWFLIGVMAVYIIVRTVQHVRERSRFSRGDHVIYYKLKFSDHPGQRAENVEPARHGEGYSYVVRKPWTVVAAPDEETVEVVTPGGKHHVLEADDPKLHRAGLLDTIVMRLKWRKQFPSADV